MSAFAQAIDIARPGARLLLFGIYTAKEAAGAVSAAESENIAFQEEVFSQQREDTAPWREAGEQALTQLQEGIASGAFDPSKFQFEEDPGYQFRLSEGIEARDRSAAARGRLQSGAQDKAITRYAEDYASGEYGAAYQRNLQEQQQNYNVLAGVAGIGQTATSQDIASRNVMAQNVGQSIKAEGSARASAYTGVGTAAQMGGQNYLLYNMMKPQVAAGG